MRSFSADGEPSVLYASRVFENGLADQPLIAVLYAVTGCLMELLGPAFWAALVILFVQAELFTR
jgi:hypothetical protein